MKTPVVQFTQLCILIYGSRIGNGIPSALRKGAAQFAGRAPLFAEYGESAEMEDYRMQTYEVGDVRSFSAPCMGCESDGLSGFNAAFWNYNGRDGDGGLAKLTLAMR